MNNEIINFNTQTYTLRICSKDRNIEREINPFTFQIYFNQNGQINQNALISDRFENIKKISVSQLCIPRYIPRDYIGEPFTGITPLYNTSNSISLSYYPGININNSIVSILDLNNNELEIEVLELVDLAYKRMFLIALQYNNPYYLKKYINIKADLFSYLNINNVIYSIINITGNIITLDNTNNYPLPNSTNFRLIIGDYYKNSLMVDTNGSKIGINSQSINIIDGNILNYQYLFKDQYLEYQVNTSLSNIYEKKLFKVSNLEISNTNNILINGIWINGLPNNFNDNYNLFFDNLNIIKLNQFNFGVRDLLDEKIFYFNLSPFIPNKIISTDITTNNTFGVLYPSTPNSSKDYIYLKGDASESYNKYNLQNTNTKLEFSLMDSNNQLIGTVYNKYPNLYKPLNNVHLTSYLPFIPDINIILKIEEIKKN